MKLKLSKFMPLVALAAAIVLVTATSCDGNDEEKDAAQGAAAAAPASEPALSPGAPETPTNEDVPGEIETAARRLLADELGADLGDFRLANSESAGWSDASLGCPKEGYAYAQVVTPGYKVVFDRAGTSYAVHTNSDGSHMVICRDGQ